MIQHLKLAAQLFYFVAGRFELIEQFDDAQVFQLCFKFTQALLLRLGFGILLLILLFQIGDHLPRFGIVKNTAKRRSTPAAGEQQNQGQLFHLLSPS